MNKKIKRNTLKTDLSIFTIKNLFTMKIIKVISFLPVTVRKIKDEQISKQCVRHYEDLNNKKEEN